MGNCIHGVNYDVVKNTVAVYRLYKTYLFCSFPFSQLLFTVWAKIKFTFCFRTMVVLRSFYDTKCPIPFLQILLFLRINDC